VDFTLKNVCVNICIGSYGTLEVAGEGGLEQLLEIPEDILVFIMGFTWSCRTPSSLYFAKY